MSAITPAAPPTKIGTKKRIRVFVYDLTVTPRVLADPTSLKVIIGRPVSAALAYTWPDDVQVVRDGRGRYHLDFVTTEAGQHDVRGEALGAIVVAEQASFLVAEKNVSAP